LSGFEKLEGRKIKSIHGAFAALSSHDYHCGSVALVFDDDARCIIGPTIDEGIYIEWSDE
jgi:hypothetical protein